MPTDAPDHVFRVGDKTYRFHFGDITAAIAMEFRKATGWKLSEFLQDGLDVDSAGVIIWLCRRMEGERVTLQEALEAIDMKSLVIGAEEIAAEATEDEPKRRNGEHMETVAAADIADDPELQGVAF